jgi:hypothetical protein
VSSLTLQWSRHAAVPNTALRASFSLARRRHAGCNSLLQNTRSVAAAGAPRRSGRTRAACGSLKRRYSDRATARIHVSATRCVDRPSKASRSPKSNAALRARSLARPLLFALRRRQHQRRTRVRRAVRATCGVRDCRRRVNGVPQSSARLFGALADATGRIIVFSRPGELTETTKITTAIS